MRDISRIKKDFPVLTANPDLVYLDTTATSLKPKVVINALRSYYEEYSANIYRGVYYLSERATEEYEKTRESVASFIHADSAEEIIFTRNTTESINIIAYSLAENIVKKGDSIAVSIMEHHSNFVPWQYVCEKKNAVFNVVGIDKNGKIIREDINQIWDDLDRYVTKKTRILSITHISNVLGVINDVKKIIKQAKRINPEIITVVDAAQSVPHRDVNVKDLGCDFLAFSSHKMMGPTGVGVLWGKRELLQHMKPFLYGGEMIREVTYKKSFFKNPPFRFEAGTPAIGEVIALRSAIGYIKKIKTDVIRLHEEQLTRYALQLLKKEVPEFKIVGETEFNNKRAGIISLSHPLFHPHDIAQILDEVHIATRAGNHCAMPLHWALNLNATIRISFYIYNTKKDIDFLIKGLKRVKKILH